MESKELSPIDDNRQNLFETILRVTGFTPLESDMDEIQRACVPEYNDMCLRNDELLDKIEKLKSRESTFKKQIEELQSKLRCIMFKLKQADKSFIEAVSRDNSLQEKVGELQSQLAEKDNLYNDLLSRYNERSNALSYSNSLATNLKSENTALKSTVYNCEANLELAQSELTSLKEKHKRDVMNAFGDGWQEGVSKPKSFCINTEQYYTQTHENK